MAPVATAAFFVRTAGVAANYAYDAVGNRLVSTNGILATAYAANALGLWTRATF